MTDHDHQDEETQADDQRERIGRQTAWTTGADVSRWTREEAIAHYWDRLDDGRSVVCG